MFLEPFGVLEALGLAGLVGDDELVARVAELMDGVLDPFALHDARRLQDQVISGGEADVAAKGFGALFIDLRRALEVERVGE